MEDGSSDIQSVYIYNGVGEVPEDATHVRVDPSITVIHQQAFRNCKKLEHIELPEGLIRIAFSAFRRCKSLKRINIPSTVVGIGFDAFLECEKLCHIILPQGLQTLGHAFRYCKSLQTIYIPPGIEVIKERTFSGCEALANVVFSEGLQEIEETAFSNCKSLVSVTLPSSLKVIGEEAFQGCDQLNEIHIPDTVESIEARAFNGCKLVSFRVPPLVTKVDIDDIVGEEDTCLISLELSESVTEIVDLFDEEQYTGLRKSIRNIVFPPKCTEVGVNMWSGYKDLEFAFPNGDNDTITEALRVTDLKDCHSTRHVITNHTMITKLLCKT